MPSEADDQGRSSELPKIRILRPEFESQARRIMGVSFHKLKEQKVDLPSDESVAGSLQAGNNVGPGSFQSSHDSTRHLAECVVGLGLMIVGIAAFAVIAWLPRKPGSWIFIAFGTFLLFAGAARLGRAARAIRHRGSKRNRAT